MPGQLRTKPLSIAAVGMTVDGREITEQDVADIVETYNPRKYGARINLDHEFNWSGWAAKNLHNVDIPGMLGDVESVEAYENEEGVVCLYAVLAPNQSFVQLNKADQAVYFSIEISRDFMGSGKTYLTGLAVTDYPASCYTDRIHFSSKSKADDTEVALLTVDLGSCEPIDTPKKPFFKRSEFGKKLDGLTAKLDSFSTTNVEDEETPPEDNENTEVAQLKEELSSTKTALDELNDKFAKALKAPAGDTTDADDEPEGDEGKYSQLL